MNLNFYSELILLSCYFLVVLIIKIKTKIFSIRQGRETDFDSTPQIYTIINEKSDTGSS
jgi:hypothetical protein